MAPIPKPESSTIGAIYRAYEAANRHFDSIGISVGEIATECDRALWYGLHWVSAPEAIEGRKISIFRTGDAWENRMVADLESIGVEVWGQQVRIRLVSGHVRGKIDGKALGIPEAPKTEHLMEFKSSNLKNFKEIVAKGCRVAKPLHYGQCQIGMHMFGLTRAGYMVTCKDDDARYFERIEYDADYCLRTLARAERIVRSVTPPARIANKEDDFRCLFCKHKAVCWGGWSRVNCRTCLHSTAEMGGDAHWSCARFSKPLGLDEQREGCPAHLYLPDLVNGQQTDCDEEAETITYRLANGEIWIDGPGDATAT